MRAAATHPVTIGILTPYTGGFYYGAILEGIQRVAARRGVVAVAVETTHFELFWPRSDGGLEYFALDSIDGWIAVNEFAGSPFTEKLRARGVPLVHLNAREAGGCAVLPDNAGGTRALVEHLLSHGHKRIGFAGSSHQVDLVERYDGYRDALKSAGLAPDPALYFSTEANLELDGTRVGQRLVAECLPCTALVAGTDKLAIGILTELQDAGVRVPEDLALVGFDDIEKAQYASPPLTTVRQPFGALAGSATTVLLDHLLAGAPLASPPRHPVVLVKRKSCGCSSRESVHPVTRAAGTGISAKALEAALVALADSGQRTQGQDGSRWSGARQISELVASLAQEGRAPEAGITGVWAGFLALNRDVEEIERAMALLEEFGEVWCAEPRLRAGLRRGLRDLRTELMRNWRILEQQRNRYYDYVAEANGKIAAALAAPGASAAMDLSWLQWTRAGYGVLGLWSDDSGDGQLEIIAEYGVDDSPLRLGASVYQAAAFPPPQLRTLVAGIGLENILTLAPLHYAGKSLGVLGVAAPLELELLDHVGSIGQWGEQVAASLERSRVEQKLREDARRDALTGLPNRMFLMELLPRIHADESAGYAVLFLDLDDFKKINDSLGHQAGDTLLVEIAARLSAVVGTRGSVARLGGDEFAIVVPNLEEDDEILELARTIQGAISAPFSLDGETAFSSCSVGIAVCRDRLRSPDEILRDADTAMYRAKLQGRARFEVFHVGMHTQAVERLRLDARLRQALEEGEFVLYYQPIVSTLTHKPVGFEALIRWQHPEQGCLSPGRFLSVAEQLGLAIPISEWVIRSACQQARQWRDNGDTQVYINVNVPTEHLQEPGFALFVEIALREYSLPGSAIGIEIVETSLIDQPAATVETLKRLRLHGVRVAIDDFGSGYSSLNYLRSLPVTTLKMDRSFVHGIDLSPREQTLARAIVLMARGLDLDVVAEGVETELEYEYLVNLGCHFVQGFFFGRPQRASLLPPLSARRLEAPPSSRRS